MDEFGLEEVEIHNCDECFDENCCELHYKDSYHPSFKIIDLDDNNSDVSTTGTNAPKTLGNFKMLDTKGNWKPMTIISSSYNTTTEELSTSTSSNEKKRKCKYFCICVIFTMVILLLLLYFLLFNNQFNILWHRCFKYFISFFQHHP